MATESSPFDEEQQIEEDLTDDLLALFARSLIFAVKNVNVNQFQPTQDYSNVRDRFRNKLSESIPSLNQVGQESIGVGLDRAITQLNLNELNIDYSDPVFREFVNDVFNKHLDLIEKTNRDMFNTLRQVGLERGWSDAELARRFKMYFGLTSNHLNTVLVMEDAFLKDGIKKSVRENLLQKRIDQLIEWRMNLFAVQFSTEIVEGSKDTAVTYLARNGQIDRSEYEKEWVSVIDGSTTTFCVSSHRMRAEIGGAFPNGRLHPPGYPPPHPCRSSIRLVKKVT